MQVNKTISLNIDLTRRVADILPKGETFSGLVEKLLGKWEADTLRKASREIAAVECPVPVFRTGAPVKG